LISFRFSSESVYNINSIFGDSCVNFFENLRNFSSTSALVLLSGIGIPWISKFCLRSYCCSSVGSQVWHFFFKIPVYFLELSIFFFEVIHIASDSGDLFEYIRKLIFKTFKFLGKSFRPPNFFNSDFISFS